MLERAPACLEQSGRALLRPARRKVRTKRSLHFAFWSHGAGEIDLPSWWLALLQRPPPTSSSASQSIADTAKKFLTAGLADGNFLDFLYPAKTLALIHKLAIRDAAYLRSRRHDARPLLSRGYSSEAAAGGGTFQGAGYKDEDNLAVESDSRHADALIAAIRNEEAKRGTPPESESSPALRSLRTLRQDMRTAAAELKTIEQESPWNEEAIEDAAQKVLSLSRKAVRAHAQYIVHQLESRTSRVGISYFALAVKAYFHLGDKERALKSYQEALAQHQDHHATPTILRLALRSRDWEFGTRAWSIFQEGPHDEKFFWRELNSMRPLDVATRASALVEFISHRGESLSQSLELQIKHFAIKMIETILQRANLKNFDVPPKLYLDLFLWLDKLTPGSASSAQYSMALRQILALNIQNKNDYASYSATAIQIYQMMLKQLGHLPNQSLVESLLHRACQIHHPDSRGMFEALKSQYSTPSLHLYNIMLRHFTYLQDVKAFYSTLDEARKHYDVPWTLEMMLNLLRVYSHRREALEAQTTFDKIGELTGTKPTSAHYNALITAYVNAGEMEKALKKMDEMKEAGLQPSAFTYRPFLKYYARRGDRKALLKYADHLLDSQRPVHDFVLESFIVACIQDEQLEEAQNLLERAQDLEIVGSRTRLWNFVLIAYARRRYSKEVEALHARMIELGIREDRMTYAALITSFTMTRRPDSAYHVLFDVMPEKGIVADSYLYSCVMMGYLNVGDVDKVFEIRDRMAKNGVPPDFSIKTIIIKATALKEVRQLEPGSAEGMVLQRAERVLADTIESSEAKDLAVMHRTPQIGTRTDPFDEVLAAGNFQFLVTVYGANHAIDRAAAIYDRYLDFIKTHSPDKELTPPRKLLASLMNLFRLGGQHDEVDRCWALARAKARLVAAPANADTSAGGWVLPARRHVLSAPLHEYMRSLVDRRDLHALDAVIADLRREGFEPDSRAWNLYVQAHALFGGGRGRTGASGGDTDPLRAFRACEAELISGWPGWPRFGAARRAVTTVARLNWLLPTEYEASRRMPSYKTMVVLASYYVRLRERWTLASDGAERAAHAELLAAAPHTVRQVSLMPRLEEPLQMAFMQGR